MENQKNLINLEHNNNELLLPFPLLKELFEFAQSAGLDENSFDNYIDARLDQETNTVKLPSRFESLINDDPSKYFVVSYDDRSAPHFKAGTRHKFVRLSTVAKKSASDEHIREIDLEELDPSLGNKARIAVADSINNKSFTNINTAPENIVEQPHGLAKNIREFNTLGEVELQTNIFSRLDEGIFPWQGQDQPVRWVRDLEVTNNKANELKTVYRDHYIIGRSAEGKEERSSITTTIVGNFQNPKSILVEIGLGPIQLTNVIFEDLENNIKIIYHKSPGAYKNELAIIGQDPNYALLFQKPVNTNELVKTLESKILMLQTDWDKPANVFAESPALTESPKQIS